MQSSLLANKLSEVETLYTELTPDDLSDYGKTTFLPTPKMEIFKALKYLVKHDVINTTKTFVDLGSGTGGVTAVVSHVFRIPSVGIEYDDHLIWYAKMIRKALETRYGPIRLRYIHGDFTDLSHYDSMDIGLLFNYIGGDYSKVLDYMPKGMLFLSYLNGGPEISLISKKEKAWKDICNKYELGDLPVANRERIVSRAVQNYSDWDFLLTIPGTDMHLYRKMRDY